MNDPSGKVALLARISSTRDLLSSDLRDLGHALDVPSRLRSSFHQHPLAWVVGAVAVGVGIANMFRKNGKGGSLAPWRPMVLGALGFLGNRALNLSRPALSQVVETELNRWLAKWRPGTEKQESEDGRVPH